MSDPEHPGGGEPPAADPSHVLVDVGADDAARVAELEDHVWFEVSPGLSAQDITSVLDWSRTRAVERTEVPPFAPVPEDGRPLAGLYTSYPLVVSVPGHDGGIARVPMSGLSWVGVHQDERRRGLLRAMMTDHLHRTHELGEEPIAGLHASEPGIYGRFGYGLASHHVSYKLGRGTALTAPAALVEQAGPVRTHLVALDTEEATAALDDVHRRAAEHTLGALTRGPGLRRVWWRDFPTLRREKEPLQLLLATRGGDVTGWAVLRRLSKWSDAGVAEGEVSVLDLGAVDPVTLLALGRRLVDVDLTSTVKLPARSIDDPLITWAGGPRTLSTSTGDSLWVRIVDLDTALSARGYAGPLDVVLEVADDLCPWNAGRWRLTCDDAGMATCVSTQDTADLTLSVRVLGAAYVGGTTLAASAGAGLVQEHTAGAVRRLSRAMRGDVEPVGAFGF